MKLNNSNSGVFRIITIFLAGIVLTGSVWAQTRPVLIKTVSINLVGNRGPSFKKMASKYRNRPLTPGLKKTLEREFFKFLQNEGYYFPKIVSEKIEIDSAAFSAKINFNINAGPVTILRKIVFQSDSTFSLQQEEKLKEIAESFYGQPYTSPLVESMLDEVITSFERNGFPLARVQTSDFTFAATSPEISEIEVTLRIQTGAPVTLQYVRYSDLSTAQTRYLDRRIGFKSGEKYDQRRVDKFAALLKKQESLKSIEPAILMRDKNGRYFLNFTVKEAPGTSFDGIIGYIPASGNSNQSGYLTGLVNVGIRNLFGPGRKFQVFWQKQDRLTDQFRLSYREPFLFGLPLSAGLGVNRLVRDTTYIEFQYQADLALPLSETLNAFIRFSSRDVTPDSLASRVLRLPRTRTLSTETGLRWNLEDDLLNPRKGLLFEIAWRLGSQQNQGPNYLLEEDSLAGSITIRRVKADLSIFLPTLRNQVFSNHFHTELLGVSGGALNLADLIWFGGATTIRGFRESQFNADQVFWVNSEYRFLLSRQARFFLFTDNGYFSRKRAPRKRQWLTSYGLGIRIPGPLGLLQVDFGLSKGTPFREGKIHFRLINEF